MKILHAADIHIGYSTHGKDDPARGVNSRWLDFENCLKFMIDYAIEKSIDLFLFCGDAYYDHSPSPTEQSIFARQIRRLLDKEIPVVMLAGNHDVTGAFGKSSSISVFAELSSKTVVFEKPGAIDLETKSGKVRIVALPWASKSRLISKEEFARLTTEKAREKMREIYASFIDAEASRIRQENLPYPSILALHAHIDGATLTQGSERRLFESDITLPLSAVARREFSYVALGHFHRHQDLNKGLSPPVVYSGSIERISFNELDQIKGFVMVEIDKDEQATCKETYKATYQHIRTPAREMVSLDIDVRNEADPMRTIRDAISRANVKDAIARLRISCKAEQKAQIDVKEIREKLLESAFIVSELRIQTEDELQTSQWDESAFTEERLLEIYIENNNLSRKKRELLALAKELIQELDQESSEASRQ